MNEAERAEGEMRLDDAQQAYRRVQVDLAEAEATICRIDISIKDSDDQRALVFWFARHAELLRTGLEAAERIAAIAAALLYVLLSDAEYVGGRSWAIRTRDAARRCRRRPRMGTPGSTDPGHTSSGTKPTSYPPSRNPGSNVPLAVTPSSPPLMSFCS